MQSGTKPPDTMRRGRQFTVVWIVICLILLLPLSGTGGVTDAQRAGAPPSSRLPNLTVEGNRIYQGSPEFEFSFHGVNRDTLEWGNENYGGCGGDGHFDDVDFELIASWGSSVVRVPLSQANWLGRGCDAQAYAGMVDLVIDRANEQGLYVILDLHWTDVEGLATCAGPACPTGQQPMPDADSIVFWEEVAARYGENPGVLFNLYNEPYIYNEPFVRNEPEDSDWACWRDGGCTVYASEVTSPTEPNPISGQLQVRPLPYTAVGMQELYDVVRKNAPDSIIVIGGLDWAYDLTGIGNGWAVDGENIVYDTHVQTQWHNTVEDWDEHFGYLTAYYPVSSTEFGSIDCSAEIPELLLDYFDAPMGESANSMSWTVWSWNAPGECSQPSVIADWEGTPLSGQGELVHERLQSYLAGATLLPSNKP